MECQRGTPGAQHEPEPAGAPCVSGANDANDALSSDASSGVWSLRRYGYAAATWPTNGTTTTATSTTTATAAAAIR